MTLAFDRALAFDHVDARHLGHLEVEDQRIGLELARLLQPDLAILGKAHDLEVGIALDDVLYDGAHDEGVVDDEDVLGHGVSTNSALGV